MRYTAPFESIFWNRESMKSIGQKILKLLCDMNFDSSPIILHVFSNGGAYLYQHFDLAVKEFQTPLEVSTYYTIQHMSHVIIRVCRESTQTLVFISFDRFAGLFSIQHPVIVE